MSFLLVPHLPRLICWEQRTTVADRQTERQTLNKKREKIAMIFIGIAMVFIEIGMVFMEIAMVFWISCLL